MNETFVAVEKKGKTKTAVKQKIHPEGVKFTPEKWYLGERGCSQLSKTSKILRIGALQLELS